MIKNNIKKEYPHHLIKSKTTKKSLFIADYTTKESSKGIKKPKNIELFTVNPPTDISYFELQTGNYRNTF